MRSLLFKVALVTSFFLPCAPVFATDVGGLICTDTTWGLAGSPHTVTGGSGIVIGCEATLTIEAGVVVKFDPNLAIVVGSASFGGGTLIAQGTEQSPVVFTSVKDPCDPCEPAAAGDWSRIHFTDYAVDASFDPCDPNIYLSGSILEHVIVEYAGYGNYAGIFAEKSSPFLNYCEVRHNSNIGIKVDGTGCPGIKIANCKVWDHPQRGIYITDGSEHRLLYNNIHDNRSGAIYILSSFCTLSENIISGNTTDGSGGGVCFGARSDNTLIGHTITGNTITNNTVNGSGGGICLPGGGGENTLSNNTMTGNSSGQDGGGIYFYGSHGNGVNWYNTLTGNTISQNSADGDGGGICFYGWQGHIAYTTLTNNTITENTAGNVGGGLCFKGHVDGDRENTLIGNFIYANTANNEGGAIYLHREDNDAIFSNTIVSNYSIVGETGGIYVTGGSEWLSLAGDPCEGTYNIIWGNDGYQIYNNNAFNADGRNDVNAPYVQWGTNDPGMIQDEIFDYFDDATKAFVVFYLFICPGDFDMDEDVDWGDLATFVDNWLRDDCGIPDWCAGTDLDLSTDVNFADFADFVYYWLEGVGP